MDETRLFHVHVRTSGWIKKVFVDYTWQQVKQGDPLFTFYSPDLLATEQEYLLALKARDSLAKSSFPEIATAGASLLEAARRRLELWDLTEGEIHELEQSGKRDPRHHHLLTGHRVCGGSQGVPQSIRQPGNGYLPTGGSQFDLGRGRDLRIGRAFGQPGAVRHPHDGRPAERHLARKAHFRLSHCQAGHANHNRPRGVSQSGHEIEAGDVRERRTASRIPPAVARSSRKPSRRFLCSPFRPAQGLRSRSSLLASLLFGSTLPMQFAGRP